MRMQGKHVLWILSVNLGIYFWGHGCKREVGGGRSSEGSMMVNATSIIKIMHLKNHKWQRCGTTGGGESVWVYARTRTARSWSDTLERPSCTALLGAPSTFSFPNRLPIVVFYVILIPHSFILFFESTLIVWRGRNWKASRQPWRGRGKKSRKRRMSLICKTRCRILPAWDGEHGPALVEPMCILSLPWIRCKQTRPATSVKRQTWRRLIGTPISLSRWVKSDRLRGPEAVARCVGP